jgi:hypothetical protein
MKGSLDNKPIKRTAKMNVVQLLNKYKNFTKTRVQISFEQYIEKKMFLRQPAAAAAAQW